jgi:hypothetical protein
MLSLAGIDDAAILNEAKRRALKLPVEIKVVYEDTQIRDHTVPH